MSVSIHLERRLNARLAMRIVVPVAAVAAGLVAGGVILALGGHDPIDTYNSMWEGSLGSSDGIQATLIKACPLVLTGLAVATWATIAAIPRALIGLNEIIVTLFLNYIAILLMDHLIFGPWADPKAFGFAYSRALPDAAMLPVIPGSYVHIGIVIAVLVAITCWWLMERTPWGFSVRVAGGNARTAEYLGLHISRRMVIVLALSGAIAGLAGAIELTGVTNRLQDGISVNYGYSGVLIAFLARGRLLGVVVSALLFATLVVGSYALQTTGVAQPIATIIQALIIVFLLAGDAALAFRVHITRAPRALEPVAAGVRS